MYETKTQSDQQETQFSNACEIIKGIRLFIKINFFSFHYQICLEIMKIFIFLRLMTSLYIIISTVILGHQTSLMWSSFACFYNQN
jgi:hypothetical protein